MRCAANERNLALLAEGDLSPARTLKLRDHLDQCPQCRKRLASIEASQSSVKFHSRIAIQPSELRGVHEAVMARVAIEPLHGRRRMAGYAAGSFVSLLVVIGLWVAPGSGDIGTPEPLAVTSTDANDAPTELAQTPPMAVELESVESTLPSGQYDYQRSDVIVKLVSDNPNIVIYWLGSSDDTDDIQS